LSFEIICHPKDSALVKSQLFGLSRLWARFSRFIPSVRKSSHQPVVTERSQTPGTILVFRARVLAGQKNLLKLAAQVPGMERQVTSLILKRVWFL
jgi:hypothetical protein